VSTDAPRHPTERRQGREAALQMLYQAEVGHLSLPIVRGSYWAVGADAPVMPPDKVRAFAERLVDGVHASLPRIDALLEQHSANWRLQRMAVVDRLVLRLAVYELLEPDGTDAAVIIDEALELAKTFSTPEAAKFVNGVLDAVRRALSDTDKGSS
jgi:N utilization substance protein B